MKSWGFFFLLVGLIPFLACSEEVPDLPQFTLLSPDTKAFVYAGDTIPLQMIAVNEAEPVAFTMYRLRLQPVNAANLPDSVPGLLTFLKTGALWVSESASFSLPIQTKLPVPDLLAPGTYLLEASLALLSGRQITDTLRYNVFYRQDTVPPQYDFLQAPPVAIQVGDSLKALMEFSDLLSNNQPGAVWRIDFFWKSGGAQRTERRVTWPLNPYSIELPMPQGVAPGPSVFWFQINDAFGNQRTDSLTVMIF